MRSWEPHTETPYFDHTRSLSLRCFFFCTIALLHHYDCTIALLIRTDRQSGKPDHWPLLSHRIGLKEKKTFRDCYVLEVWKASFVVLAVNGSGNIRDRVTYNTVVHLILFLDFNLFSAFVLFSVFDSFESIDKPRRDYDAYRSPAPAHLVSSFRY